MRSRTPSTPSRTRNRSTMLFSRPYRAPLDLAPAGTPNRPLPNHLCPRSPSPHRCSPTAPLSGVPGAGGCSAPHASHTGANRCASFSWHTMQRPCRSAHFPQWLHGQHNGLLRHIAVGKSGILSRGEQIHEHDGEQNDERRRHDLEHGCRTGSDDALNRLHVHR